VNKLPVWRRFGFVVALCVVASGFGSDARCEQSGVDDDDELATIVISSTRIPRLIGDEPLRVEAVPAEEIAENSTVRPGDVTSLLAELSGVRFESASPGLGSTGMRLRGFPARHALVLLDGLPLASESTASFGLLQFPPLDLERVEVIKGSANSLYGQDALAGVLNLVSMPSRGASLVTVDRGSGGADNLTAFLRSKDSSLPELSLLLYRSRQVRDDIDRDGWAEIAGFDRYGARSRLTLHGAEGRYAYLTLGATNEDRYGGSVGDRSSSNAGFALRLGTRRRDAGLVARLSPSDESETMLRGSVSREGDVRQVGTRVDDYAYGNAWFELTRAGRIDAHDWVLGTSAEERRFDFRRRRDLEYSRKSAGLFVEDAYQVSDRFSLHASGRHEWGDFEGRNSARFAALYRGGPSWSLRMSIGGGQAMPGYALPEVSDYGPGALTLKTALKTESATTTSIDVDWHPEDIEIDLGLFDGRIRRALDVRRVGLLFEVFNRSGNIEFRGMESTVRFVEGPWHMIGSWTMIDATLREGGVTSSLPYMPKQSGELAVLYEVPKAWRAGIEFSYTGTQYIEEIGRDRAPATLEISLLFARTFGDLTVFCNAMNLTDERQTKRFGLLRADVAQSGIPVNETWGSLTGRVVNIGLRRAF
jgi:outer membrane receptor for ferrienterochelin and colicins